MNILENLQQKASKMIVWNRETIIGPRILTKQTTQNGIEQSMQQTHVSIFSDDHNDEDSGTLTASSSTSIDDGINILSTIDVDTEVLCCKYTEKYNYIVAGLSNGRIHLYQSRTGEFFRELSDRDTIDNTSVTSITHQPVSTAYPINNCIICSYLDGLVKCWNYNFRQCLYTIKENRQIYGLTYHPHQTKFLTYGNDSTICLYDEETRAQERILKMPTSSEINFYTCRFNPSSNYEFISASWDNQIHFWDLRQPYYTRSIPNVYICGDGLDINKKGTEILACANQTKATLQIFDYATGGVISKVDVQYISSKLYTAKYAAANYAVVGGTDPNSFQVIDLKSLVPVATITNLPTEVNSLDLGEPKLWKNRYKEAQFSSLPTVVFSTNTKLYEVDFC